MKRSTSPKKKAKGEIVLGKEWKNVTKYYTLIEHLGEGSYGKVVKAKHNKTGLVVAIKHMKIKWEHDYEIKKIVREIQMLRQLTQMPNNKFTSKILDIYLSSDEEDLFIVMDYMEMDLKKTLNASHTIQFSEKHLIQIMYNFLCCLSYIHSANIMHRDIKPSNILIDQNCDVKICDFGLSRTMHLQTLKQSGNNKMSNYEIAQDLVSRKK